MFVWRLPQSAKPPWNQPHVRPLAPSRSPTFRPPISAVRKPALHLSKSGRSSPNTVPGPCVVGTPGVFAVEKGVGHPAAGTLIVLPPPHMAPNVLPLIRFNAPGVEGPYPVLNALSLIAKRWA